MLAVKYRWMWALCLNADVLSGVAVSSTEDDVFGHKAAFTVESAIQLRQLVDPDPVAQYRSGGTVRFNIPSDGRRVTVVSRRGNLVSGANEYELWVYDSAEILGFLNNHQKEQLPRPRHVVTFTTRSHRHGIDRVSWLAHGSHVAFIGRDLRGVGQVYLLDAETGALEQLTSSDTDILEFAVSPGGRKLIYRTPEAPDWTARNQRGYAVRWDSGTWDGFRDLGIDDPHQTTPRRRWWLKDLNTKMVRQVGLPSHSAYDGVHSIASISSISPSGRWAVIREPAFKIPERWLEYKFLEEEMSEGLQALVWAKDHRGIRSRAQLLRQLSEVSRTSHLLRKYWIVDMTDGAARPLLDAPAARDSRIWWAPDEGQLMLAETYLPLDAGSNTCERRNGVPAKYVVIDVSVGDWSCLKSALWQPSNPPPRLTLTIQEDLNFSPEIRGQDSKTGNARTITDLNPQLREFMVAHTELFRWTSRLGGLYVGGLLMPPSHAKAKRYPLVIQTHGFNRGQFLVSGSDTGGAAYAAQALANRDLVVLQVSEYQLMTQGPEIYPRQEDWDTKNELPLVMAMYEGAIDALDAQGLIDRERVAIIGWSRTGSYVHHMLAFSQYPIAAATVTDATGNTPFSYVLRFGSWGGGMSGWEGLGGYSGLYTGNGAPFWGEGIKFWLKRSYFFHLDRIQTPIRYEQTWKSSVVSSSWDVFALQKRMLRPVEMIHIPSDDHILHTPLGRYTSQQGNVDWFDFWLNEHEDPDPIKAEQYGRWRVCREQRDAIDRLRRPNVNIK